MAKSLRVEIVGDASSYSRALGAAARATTGFGSGLGRLAKTAAFTAGAAGIGALAVVLKTGISEWVESTKVAAQTGAVLKSTGGAANVTAKEVDNLAQSLMRKSGIDDEAIKSGENMLLTFRGIHNEVGKGNNIFDQATIAVTDMDVAMTHGSSTQESLSKTAILVGKALNDPIKGATALRRVGVQLTESQTAQIAAFVKTGNVMGAQKVILAELTKEFGGSAKAMGDTLPGKLNILRESFRNLSAQLLTALIPALTRLIDWVVGHMPQIEATFRQVFGVIGSIISGAVRAFQSLSPATQKWVAIAAGLAAAFTPVLGVVGALGTKLGGLFRAGTFLVANPWIAGLALLGVAVAALTGHFNIAGAASRNLAAALNAQKTAADALKGTLLSVAQENINLAAAHQQVTSTAHDVSAAENTYADTVKRSGAGSLEAKQAGDQLASSRLASQQAVLNLSTAEDTHAAAVSKANAQVRAMVPSMTALLTETSKALATFGKGPEAIRATGIELQKTGQAAFTASFHVAGTSPAAQLAMRSFATLQIAAGSLARELGKVPTNKQIVARAKLDGGPAFINGLKLFVKAADEAGIKVPAFIRAAVAPTRAAAQAVVGAVSGQSGAARSAGTAVGSNLGSGIANGIAGFIGVAIANARALVAGAIAAAQSAAQAQSDSKITLKLGKDVALGFAHGIIQNAGVAEGAAKQAVQRTIAAMQAAQLVSLVNQYGKIIGVAHAKGVVDGIFAGTPGIVAQAKAALVAATAAARQAVVDAKAGFITAFNDLANAALTAFDTRWAAWVPPAQRLLDKMNLAEQAKQVQDQLATAMTAVTGGGVFDASVLSKQLGEGLATAMSEALGSIAGAKTEEALNRVAAQVQTNVLAAIDQTAAAATTQAQAAVDAARTALTAAQAGGDPDAIAAAQTALDTAVGNQQRLEAAILAEKELALGLLVAAETKRHEAIGVTQREGLAKQLAGLKTELLKHPPEWDKMGVEVQKILTSYNIKLQTAGTAWANKFGDGIRAGIPAAERAAHALADAVAAILPSTSSPLKPAKKGPLSFHPRTMGKAWATALGAGLASGGLSGIMDSMVPSSLSLGGGTVAASRNGMVAAGAGGAMTIYLTVNAETDDPRRLAQALVEPIRRELYRVKGRNGTLDF